MALYQTEQSISDFFSFLSGCSPYIVINGSPSYNRSPGDGGLYPMDTQVTVTCGEGYLVSHPHLNPAQCSASGDNGAWYYHSIHCSGNEMNRSIVFNIQYLSHLMSTLARKYTLTFWRIIPLPNSLTKDKY